MITLGLNYSQTHDSAAAIAVDEEIQFAIAEERVSRMKHDGRFPVNAINACLKHLDVKLEQVDQIVCGWPPLRQIVFNDVKNHLLMRHPASPGQIAARMTQGMAQAYLRSVDRQFRLKFGDAKYPIRHVDHHYAHAISAYAASGFEDAIVFVIDGRGTWEATSVWIGKNATLTNLNTIAWPNSIGLFYAMFTGYLGFEKYADEWKVMGLAPYGRAGIDLSAFVTYGNGRYDVRADLLLSRKNGREYGHIEAVLGPSRNPDEELTQRHKDIAFAVQSLCEEIECDLVSHFVTKTGIRNVCVAGGVGLNSKANGLFLQRGLMDRIFVQPAAGDDGVALGAALVPAFEAGKRPQRMVHCYYGPSYSDEVIRQTLDTYKIDYTQVENAAAAAANLLAAGCLVGWFQGREEFGPRALGNRSILADPRYEENRDKVNMAVKFREEWRPFAPSVLASACDGLFEAFHESPFMILTFQAREAARSKIAAAIHVDGSARVQSVTKEQNPLYYDLITEFGKLTGAPALLNTSFNLKGEAIVNTPFDAIRTFYTSGLDALVIGNFVLRKKA